MKVIIKALNTYQQVYKCFYSKRCEEVDKFIEMLRTYEQDSIEKFMSRIDNSTELVIKNNVLNNREVDYRGLGIEYYKNSENQHLFSEELKQFLEINKNEKFIEVLDGSIQDIYVKLEKINLKYLKVKEIKFLGYALFNINLKGSTKGEQKKNLLQLLDKSIQTQKMNEIYESAL